MWLLPSSTGILWVLQASLLILLIGPLHNHVNADDGNNDILQDIKQLLVDQNSKWNEMNNRLTSVENTVGMIKHSLATLHQTNGIIESTIESTEQRLDQNQTATKLKHANVYEEVKNICQNLTQALRSNRNDILEKLESMETSTITSDILTSSMETSTITSDILPSSILLNNENIDDDPCDITDRCCVNGRCLEGYWQCNNGECIRIRYRFDGYRTCSDGSDEEVPTNSSGFNATCNGLKGISFGNDCLQFKQEKLNWDNATAACKSRGHQLASLEHHQAVIDYIKVAYYSREGFWVGGSDTASEGNWVWLDGQPIDTQTLPWYYNQGNSGRGENCLRVALDGYYDYPCSAKRWYICELQIE